MFSVYCLFGYHYWWCHDVNTRTCMRCDKKEARDAAGQAWRPR